MPGFIDDRIKRKQDLKERVKIARQGALKASKLMGDISDISVSVKPLYGSDEIKTCLEHARDCIRAAQKLMIVKKYDDEQELRSKQRKP